MIARVVACAIAVAAAAISGHAQETGRGEAALDGRVARFLEQHRDLWRDENVPEADARALHDLILERRYTRVLEIGTSTGRSALWMARALARTGGHLTTIEIDEARRREALKNFEAAGVAALVTARLGDARRLVRRLAGPFDLVFIDADSDWYTGYAKAVLPRLAPGGALAAHDVVRAKWPGAAEPVVVGQREFYRYVMAQPGIRTGFRAGLFLAFTR
jgi:predicted O-methyltransferase YrrM